MWVTQLTILKNNYFIVFSLIIFRMFVLHSGGEQKVNKRRKRLHKSAFYEYISQSLDVISACVYASVGLTAPIPAPPACMG